jgi:HPt (histidine-containing phosphotransfer) domain-containing protein
MFPVDNHITDLTYLKELSKGDDSFVRNMMQVFLEENPGEIEQLKESIATGDYTLIYANAHRLKSSTPFVGVYKLIEPDVLGIESIAKAQGSLDEINKLFENVSAVCLKAREELQEELESTK